MLSWYKTLSESFPMIKDMQSPPLLRIQPDFFVKRSLNWDGCLFSYAWKSLSIRFCPIAFCQQFYFLFAWKILSIWRSSYIIRSQQRVLPLTVPPDLPIFFLGVKFSLCSMPCSLLFYFRCIVIYCFCPCCIAFYFTVKTALFSMLTAKLFSFSVKIPLFSLSNFSIKRDF